MNVRYLFSVFLLVVFLGSCWLWDVAHVVYYHGTGVLTNGLWSIDAMLTYHVAWYVAIACFLVLFVLYVHEIGKKGK
jgi:hypothetical protein